MLRVMLVLDDYNELIYLQTLLKKLGLDVEGLQNQRRYADLSLGFNPHVLIATAHGRKVDGIQLGKSITKRRGFPKILALRSSDQKIDTVDMEEAGIDAVLESPINVRKFILALSQLGDLDETAMIEKFNKIKGSLSEAAKSAGSGTYSMVDESGEPVARVREIQESMESIITGKAKPSATIPDEKTFHPADAKSSQRDQFEMGSSDSEDNMDNLDQVANESIQHLNEEGNSTNLGSENVTGPEMLKEFDANAMKGRFDSWLKKLDDPGAGHFDRNRIIDFNKKIRASTNVEDLDQIEDERKKFVRALFHKK